jgi:hypothetical protein
MIYNGYVNKNNQKQKNLEGFYHVKFIGNRRSRKRCFDSLDHYYSDHKQNLKNDFGTMQNGNDTARSYGWNYFVRLYCHRIFAHGHKIKTR